MEPEQYSDAIVGVTEARLQLAELLSQACYLGQRTAIRRHGKVVAVLVPVSDVVQLEEFLDAEDNAEIDAMNPEQLETVLVTTGGVFKAAS